ncbi:hypothetical protein HXX76_000457 [Chlamydomonas incerta]|uniref:1-alkyl-2-acetylglycerophosphocholine esterase n=1 Tax=Chlamydomonas incerta TaxID=51695 RepID=A0A836B2X9_CHLIN|nr:hypothetical protein HXX76_000457 [Chlamydomonas incerta]|eukprot:KAG2445853.1 hypothetical protein HXX76_000457 [Chlamydomonas incerta]
MKHHAAQALMTGLCYGLGTSRPLPVHYQAPVEPGSSQFPVVVFSHGLAGTRNAYSSICIELASQGYVVMALEHSDGSASTARLPRRPAPAASAATPAASGTSGSAGATAQPDAGGSEWCWYGGLGDKPSQLQKTRHRVAEVEAAYRLLERLNQGQAEGVRELPAVVAAGLRGRLDMSRAAVIGHSYGGATAAGAASQLPVFKAAVCLDPWWDCFPEEWPTVQRWPNPAPMLVIGSHDWNTPGIDGKLKCGGENQERVLAAAAAGGGGALLVVPRHSNHGSFDDVMLLFGKSMMHVLALLGLKSSLEPRLAHRINMWCIRHFLDKHLPAAAAAASATAATPIRWGDDQAFRDSFVGEHAAILRVCPAAGVVAGAVDGHGEATGKAAASAGAAMEAAS